MGVHSESEIDVYTIPGDVIEKVLHSDEWFDGMHLTEDEHGQTRIYWYGGLWSLQLFFMKLAQATTCRRDGQTEFESVYGTVADLSLDMSMPRSDITPDRAHYYYVITPNIKIAAPRIAHG